MMYVLLPIFIILVVWWFQRRTMFLFAFCCHNEIAQVVSSLCNSPESWSRETIHDILQIWNKRVWTSKKATIKITRRTDCGSMFNIDKIFLEIHGQSFDTSMFDRVALRRACSIWSRIQGQEVLDHL